MQINHVIIHELIKEQYITEAKVEFSSNVLTVDDKVSLLIAKLNERFSISSRAGVTYGVFDQDEALFFPQKYRDYHQSQTVDSFVTMTSSVMDNLREQVVNIPLAKGGYLVFADYQLNHDYFGIFLIRNTSGMLFSKDTTLDTYSINSVTHIDLEKIAMGCRINQNNFEVEEIRYLSFIKKDISDVSGYFINWICAVELINNLVYTETLYKIANRIPLPKDENNSDIISREELKKKIHDISLTSPSETINLADLSSILYGDATTIQQFAEENDYEIDSEFKPDKRILKKFTNISVNEDGIKLEFTFKDFNDKIKVIDNQVIIESERLVAEIQRIISE
ncbi:nucleoid-associated protein [Pseudanabaena sp. PCC 6802]|uniref:nucleoid-associated protein n=1 Tax=Pseudanabaena sp. PCC 6802 TaxID=118173 RepID=UPI0003477F78|nr:nucleoid-associated protein [Pseudanabaena sp. PCC 6802]